MSSARVHVLWVLGMAGPSTQQSLARALDVTPRNVTGLVDRLVASGDVTREAHPTDRRATLVTPTELGVRTIDGFAASHTHLVERLFGDVPANRPRGLQRGPRRHDATLRPADGGGVMELVRRARRLAWTALRLELTLYRALGRWITPRPDVPAGTPPIGYSRLPPDAERPDDRGPRGPLGRRPA